MLAVGLALLCSASARAGTYEVWSCAGPDGKPVPADGWRSEGYGYFSSPSNDCAGGNGLFAGLNGDFDHGANTEILTWHYQVPAPLKIASYRLWRAVRTGPNSTNASSVYWMSRQANQYTGAYVVTPENCPGCGAMGDLNAHFVNANLVSESGLADVRDLFLNAGCGGVTGWNCRADASADPYMVYFRMYRAAVVLQDDSDPVFTSPPAGSLTAGGVLAGTHGVSFSATDTGSGVYRAIIEVDGKQAVTQLLGCAEPFIAIAPCKPAASGTVSLDTTTLADGPHTVRVVVTDATYANTAAFGPFTITTSNAPTSCAPAESPDLSVRFDRRRSTISYGGRLNVIGQAPPAAQVRVFSQISRAGAPAKLGRTPAHGRCPGQLHLQGPRGSVAQPALRLSRSRRPALPVLQTAERQRARAGDAQGLAALDPLRLARALQRQAARRLCAEQREARRTAGPRARPVAQHPHRPDERQRCVQLPLPILVPRRWHHVPGACPRTARRLVPVRARHVQEDHGSRALSHATTAASPSSKPRSSMSSSPAARRAAARCG
jgi:hypothetical protein